MKLVKVKFKILSALSPKLAAKEALSLFQKPHFKKMREREKDFFTKARELRIKNEGEDIILYALGDEKGKAVLLVHGWDSNPGSMSGIADELVKNGFYVLAFNVPAHGVSRLKKTNMLDTSELIIKVLDTYKHLGRFSFVTHSFGSGAVSFALNKSKIKVDKLVFVTSPDKLVDVFKDFADFLGLNSSAFKYMISITEERFNMSFEQMQISKLIQKVDYNGFLIIHDKEDKVLPFENAQRIHSLNPQSILYATNSKGHYRILWDKDVLKKIASFLLD